MMSGNNKYPRIGRSSRIPDGHTKGRGLCKRGQRAEYRIDIEWSIFRGDDYVVKACEKHRRDITFLTGVGNGS